MASSHFNGMDGEPRFGSAVEYRWLTVSPLCLRYLCPQLIYAVLAIIDILFLIMCEDQGMGTGLNAKLSPHVTLAQFSEQVAGVSITKEQYLLNIHFISHPTRDYIKWDRQVFKLPSSL